MRYASHARLLRAKRCHRILDFYSGAGKMYVRSNFHAIVASQFNKQKRLRDKHLRENSSKHCYNRLFDSAIGTNQSVQRKTSTKPTEIGEKFYIFLTCFFLPFFSFKATKNNDRDACLVCLDSRLVQSEEHEFRPKVKYLNVAYLIRRPLFLTSLLCEIVRQATYIPRSQKHGDLRSDLVSCSRQKLYCPQALFRKDTRHATRGATQPQMYFISHSFNKFCSMKGVTL